MNLMFMDYEIDLRRQELRRAGAPVHIEPQVFDLLVHLIRNRDRIVGKDELFEKIWNGRIVSEAALSSRINAARKVIGDDGDRQSLIKTIHKRGFRFVGAVDERPGEPLSESVQAGERSDQVATALVSPADGATASRKPAIAVLPFVNLSKEPDTDYFSYGLTEDVIRVLARHRWLDVLSRHSGAAFLGRETDPREIGAALGVRYLVEGRVAKEGDRVRITADLVSAETGSHLWWETYDIALADVLEVQKAMAQQVAAVIEPELARLEREAAVRRPPVNLGAWDCYQRGLWHLWAFTSPSFSEAEVMFHRAIELDPSFARAYGALAYVTLQSLILRSPDQRTKMLADALEYARTSVSLDDQDCMNLCVVGRVLCFKHEYEEAIAYLEQAIDINPSFAQAHFALGFTLIACGRPADAVVHLQRANELSPRDPHLASFYATRALAHFSLGDLDTAVGFARRGTRVSNANQLAFSILASLLGLQARTEEAERAVAALLQKYPTYTIATARSDFFFCSDQALIERYLQGLRQAGVPETLAATQYDRAGADRSSSGRSRLDPVTDGSSGKGELPRPSGRRHGHRLL
jgi:TolB-like protein/Tfp pilus assembly protein PilF